jgi:transposase InsO family protein
VRDQVVDFVQRWSEEAEISVGRFISWLGVTVSKFYNWRPRYGRVNEHNGWVPRDFGWSRGKGSHHRVPSEESVGGLSTADVHDVRSRCGGGESGERMLKQAGLLSRWKAKSSRKGIGFEQAAGNPEARPRIISDNGPQFIARDFKEFIRISGMTHVRTSPFYPQANGKIERWHKSLKRECIRPLTPLTLDDARRLIQIYVDHYNTVLLHSAIGYVTPQDRLAGRQAEIHAARDRKWNRLVAGTNFVGSR